MHQHGQGVEQDSKMAVDYYLKGCELGTLLLEAVFCGVMRACVSKVIPVLISAWHSATLMAREWTFP
jgi:hypothetical protein